MVEIFEKNFQDLIEHDGDVERLGERGNRSDSMQGGEKNRLTEGD